jgi:hypothetical protein
LSRQTFVSLCLCGDTIQKIHTISGHADAFRVGGVLNPGSGPEY